MGDPRDGFTFNDDGTPRGDSYSVSKAKAKAKKKAKKKVK